MTPILGLACLLTAWAVAGAPLTDPEVDRFNVRLGSQTFGPKYQFTTNTALVETAEAILGMGSDILKFYLGKGLSRQYPGITVPAAVTNLLTLARDEPSCRRVLDLPFRHYLIWSYCFAASSDAWWSDGFTAVERDREYQEIYAFARYLLTNYNQTGKRFYLGHWEGDWYLLPAYNTSANPTATAIQGMIDWLNTRQQAVDDAMRDVPHTNVAVFHYTEVNRVRDAMVNGPTNNQRLVNRVLPNVTNLDFVSWSSYDGMNLGSADLHATLDYIEAHLPTAKAAAIPGKRVWIGEYGWGGSKGSVDQEPLTRAYLQKLLPWGPRFILFWEIYDNEDKAFWLIDRAGNRTPCYWLHQRLANHARMEVGRFKEKNGRLPTDAEFGPLVAPALSEPLPEPLPLVLSDQTVLSLTGGVATVSATLSQGVYGDDGAAIWVYWGSQDGGTLKSNWANAALVGVNSHFNPAAFEARLTNTVAGTNLFFRFNATNRAGEVWATNSIRLRVEAFNPAGFGSRLKIKLASRTSRERLTDFPVLVQLSTNLTGFDYRQFASATGEDLRFANASGTVPLAHEIDEWNTNGVSSVWVRVPVLTGDDDSIWAYWGNPRFTPRLANDPDAEVWSDAFEFVWHFNRTDLPFVDSTGRHTVSSVLNPVWGSAGAIGHGGSFSGTSYLDLGVVDVGSRFTLSTWVKVDSSASSTQTLWANKPGGSLSDGFALFVNSWQSRDRRVLLETGNGASGALATTHTAAVSPDVWHQVVATVDRDAGVARLYVDGVERTTAASARTDFGTQKRLILGAFADHLYGLKGTLDEARVERLPRSSNWVWASWLAVASNHTFAVAGPVLRQSPQLAAAIVAQGVVLDWAAAMDYALYSTPSLVASVWSRVTNSPVLADGHWRVSLPVPDTSERYYRLELLP